jgi:LysR family transcriptional activator of nhaA
MQWLNYHHFFYFWMVAKEGSIARASEKLSLAHPTISGQIHRLQEVLGEKLFVHQGRRLVLTDVGQTAFRYADEIFTLGHEFMDALKGRRTDRPLRLTLGLSDVLSKSLVQRIVEPALKLDQPVQLICREDKSIEEFVAELALHRVDAVIADYPAGHGLPIRTFNHLLGECDTSFFASPTLAKRIRKGFPRSLDGAPFLMPGAHSASRRLVEQWLASQEIRPKIAAELDDSALMKVFGEDGLGVFAAPSVAEADVAKRYRVRVLGRIADIQHRFYVVSVERQIKHPGVVAMCKAARSDIFQSR